MNQRLDSIDLAKGIAIFLMILCHSGMNNGITQWIYAFHMPLFFVVSGYLYNGQKIELLDYIMKKASQLLIPYFIFALIFCFGSNGLSDWGYILYGSRNTLFLAKSFTPLWFLPCFFIATIVFRTISNCCNVWVSRVICLILGIIGFGMQHFKPLLSYGFPFSIDVSFVGVLLMAVGCEIKNLRRTLLFTPVGGGILLIIGSLMAFVNLPDSLTIGNPHVEMAVGAYGNPFLFIITALLLCTSLIVLLDVIKINNRISHFIVFIGRNSMAFLCIHGLTNAIVIGILSYLHLKELPVLICFISLTLCSYATLFLNNACPNIIGKR